MTNLIETVSRALATEPMPGDYDEVPPAEVFSRERYRHLKQGYERQAKAAIRALLDAIAEPSGAQLEAGSWALRDCYSLEPGEGFDEDPPEPVYRAMIAALREEIGE